jgi:hypothetical protein
LYGFKESEQGMANRFDSFAGVTIIYIPLYILALVGPVVFPGEELQCAGPSWVSGNKCIIMIMQETKAEFIILRHLDKSLIC